MAQFFTIHPENPQHRLLQQAVQILQQGGVIAYPTDSSYALGCLIGQKEAQDRIRAIRQVDSDHHFSLVCRNLAELANYAQVDNAQFRLLKANTPGAYTFILKATRELPRRLHHPKRSTIGLRVPDHQVTQSLLEVLGQPLLSMTLRIPDEDYLNDAWSIRDRLEHQIDLVIDAGDCSLMQTTVIDLSQDAPILLRAGAGDLFPFGLKE